MNKIIEEKCNAYEAKGILGYRRGKTYAAVAKENKRREAREGQKESENTNRRDIGNEAKKNP